MHYMKHTICFFIFLLCFSCSHSQVKDGVFHFTYSTFDLGDIRETDELKKVNFIAKNESLAAVKIDTVLTSCDCSTPSYSTTLIEPGDSTTIDVVFDPQNRLGKFEKSIKVVMGVDTIPLTFIGNVRPRKETDVLLNFPKEATGCIVFETKQLSFETVYNNQPKTLTIFGYNQCDKSVKLSYNSKLSAKHIATTFKDTLIASQTHFQFDLLYNPTLLKDYGYRSDSVFFLTTEKEHNKKAFSVQSTIVEDFSGVDPLLAPSVAVSKSIIDFSTSKSGAIIEKEYEVKNEGKSDLIIRKIAPTCECVSATMEQLVIPTGGSAKLHVRFDSKGKSGYQRKTIVLITNDPKAPYLQLQLQGKILH